MEITLKHRNLLIGKLQRELGETTLDFLQDAEKVITHMKTTPTKLGKLPANSTVRWSLATIKATLRDAKLPCPEIYSAELIKYVKEEQILIESQTKSEAQEKNWIEWSSVASLAENMDISSREYLIYCLYTMNAPVRLDYTPMKWVTEEQTDTSMNYLIKHDDGTHTFVINAYKTAKLYGQITFKASPELDEVLKVWRGCNQTDEYLLMSKGKVITAPALGKLITSIFGCGVNILRHAYISHKRGGDLSLIEKKELASKMGHNPTMQELYRKIK
jgi:hypothetical protein